MQIIKDNQLIENAWTHIGDEADISNSGNITVSLQRWNEQGAQLLNRTDKVGIRLKPADAIEDLPASLQGVELIELDFPVFTDGRLFSHARLLRDRFGYQGEIRAVGNYLTDQVYYLRRVGVNAFELSDDSKTKLLLTSLKDFSVNYQVSTV